VTLFLKEIGIKGFKSFANKIKLNITPGITVIVGPNGCGKSNIIDAVRWILGEQNIRSLRGAKITDMIFAGNKEQKMGNFAQVYMQFDNAERKTSFDSEEIEVKRILYRSGEIENFINGIPCKLKDIQELFLGSGLGKHSYSIIAQGKVDFLLNARPAERRILFEEASDVSIYRNKKEHTLKKLEAIESNLIRINDILCEVEDTLSHIKKKSDDLETYRTFQNQILQLEYYLLVQQYGTLQSNITKSHKKIDILRNEISKNDGTIIEYKNKIFRIEQEKDQSEKQLNEYLNLSQENDINKNSFINQLAVIDQKKIDIEKLIQSSKEDMLHAQSQYKKYRDNLSLIQENIRETRQSEEYFEENFKKENTLLEKYNYLYNYYREKLLNVMASSKDVKKFYNNYREALIIKKEEVRSRNISIMEIKKEIESISQNKSVNQRLMQNINLELSVLERNTIQFKEDEGKKKKELEKMGILIEREGTIIQKYHNELKLKNREIVLLKELIDTAQEAGKAKQELRFEKEDLKDIINFCELKKVVLQIPDYLKKVFYYILDDGIRYLHLEHSDKISLLKKHFETTNVEKIKIVTNDLISPAKHNLKTLMNSIKLDKGKIIGFASQLISFPPQYKVLIESTIGHILIVEDTVTALSIARQIKGQLVIISLDGTVINERGMVTIGFSLNVAKRDSYEISRTRIQTLQFEINTINNELQKKKLLLEAEKGNYNILLNGIQDIGKQLEDIIVQINEKKVELAEIKNNISVAEDLLKSLKNRQGEETAKAGIVKKVMEDLCQDIQKFDNFFHSLSLYHNCLSKFKVHSNRIIDGINKNIDSFKMELSLSRERGESLQKRKNEMEQFIRSFNQEEKGREEKLLYYDKNYIQLTVQESELKENLDSCLKKEKNYFSDINRMKNTLKEQEYSLKKIREKIEIEQKQLDSKKNSLHECEMTLVQNQEKLSHLLQTIDNQFNTTINEILCHKNHAKNQTEALTSIAEYKEEIKSMGHINYNAPLEYQEQLTKFKELNSKKEEIVQSKEKLLALIDEIDRIAKDHFYKTFQEVDANFKEIFKKLFYGGQASLELTDNKKLLETGIEVLVQPPGKQVQNISLLSSGEKALTAIALLFALWKTNPTPFCFFDEIDSSLDEINAIRLSSFIKNYDLKDSQIIMITHQKEVMKMADALYGITMDGNGTSKLMSIKMLDLGG